MTILFFNSGFCSLSEVPFLPLAFHWPLTNVKKKKTLYKIWLGKTQLSTAGISKFVPFACGVFKAYGEGQTLWLVVIRPSWGRLVSHVPHTQMSKKKDRTKEQKMASTWSGLLRPFTGEGYYGPGRLDWVACCLDSGTAVSAPIQLIFL